MDKDGSKRLHIEKDLRSLGEILEVVSGDPNGAINDVFMEMYRRIVKIIHEIHTKNMCHGHLSGQTIYVELNMHASIEGGAVKDVVVSTPNNSGSIIDDVRALGNLLLCWYSNGVQRTSNDILQDGEVRYEARHLIGRMLQLKNYPPCRTLHGLLEDPGLWYASKRLRFFEDLGDYVGNSSLPEYDFLKAPMEEIKEDVLPPAALGQDGWASSFDKKLIEKAAETARQQKITYGYRSVGDLLRFLRNIIMHRYEIPEVELEFGGTSDTALEFGLSRKFPRLLLGLYKAMNTAWEAQRYTDPKSLKECEGLSKYF